MTGTVRAVEEEFWAIQYTTSVAGHDEPAFWPPDGDGKHSTEAKAFEAARRSVESGYGGSARVLHVTRRIEFGPELTQASFVDGGVS